MYRIITKIVGTKSLVLEYKLIETIKKENIILKFDSEVILFKITNGSIDYVNEFVLKQLNIEEISVIDNLFWELHDTTLLTKIRKIIYKRR